jgi:hypothetical protein
MGTRLRNYNIWNMVLRMLVDRPAPPRAYVRPIATGRGPFGVAGGCGSQGGSDFRTWAFGIPGSGRLRRSFRLGANISVGWKRQRHKTLKTGMGKFCRNLARIWVQRPIALGYAALALWLPAPVCRRRSLRRLAEALSVTKGQNSAPIALKSLSRVQNRTVRTARRFATPCDDASKAAPILVNSLWRLRWNRIAPQRPEKIDFRTRNGGCSSNSPGNSLRRGRTNRTARRRRGCSADPRLAGAGRIEAAPHAFRVR